MMSDLLIDWFQRLQATYIHYQHRPQRKWMSNGYGSKRKPPNGDHRWLGLFVLLPNRLFLGIWYFWPIAKYCLDRIEIRGADGDVRGCSIFDKCSFHSVSPKIEDKSFYTLLKLYQSLSTSKSKVPFSWGSSLFNAILLTVILDGFHHPQLFRGSKRGARHSAGCFQRGACAACQALEAQQWGAGKTGEEELSNPTLLNHCTKNQWFKPSTTELG